jgi:hypothetical protein
LIGYFLKYLWRKENMLNKEDIEMIERIENEIKFKRFLSLLRVCVAIGLVLSIVWFGWVNYSYANDINDYRQEYGKEWSCYLCGYENLKQTLCIYKMGEYKNIEVNESFRKNLAEKNIETCGYTPAPLKSFELNNYQPT